MALYHAYISWIALLSAMLLLFFVVDRRKISGCKTGVPKGINIVLVVALLYIAVRMIITIQWNTPMEPVRFEGVLIFLEHLRGDISMGIK